MSGLIVWIGGGASVAASLWIGHRDARRREAAMARRPIANRYAEIRRPW